MLICLSGKRVKLQTGPDIKQPDLYHLESCRREKMLWYIVVGYLTLWNCHLLVLGQTTDDKPKIEFLQIQSDIKFRFATTLVTSRMVNPSSTAKEAKFEVTLPDEAFISDFVMEIGGRLYPGEINEKEVAKKKYDTAKKKGQSAGHVSQKPRAANRFSVDVNVGAQEKVTFNLTYQELLHRSQGTYEHVIYIDPGQIVPELRIDVSILESRDITNVMVPPLRNDLLMTESLKGRNSLALIERPTQKSARITYFPSEADQRAKSDQGISGLFVVEYDIEREADAGDVMVVNGYFVHFFAPSDMDPIPKDALFILDVSGSMSGKKIAQVKDAMIKILDELQVGDRFNIMEFSSRVTYWRPGTVVTVDRQTIRAAKSYVRKINSGGMTNINDAMLQGIDFLNGLSNKENRSQIVLFLTDGQPSAGDTNIGRILSNVKSRNDKDVPVYSLAFGAGANYEFVKKVAVQNDGVSRRIFEDSDAALQISGFYDEISAASLKNVTFKYLEDGGSGVSNLTNSRFNSYLSGGELVVAGKMDDNTLQLFDLKVQGLGAKGSIELALTSDLQQPPIPDLTKQADYQKITEKIWAFLTIKELLEKSIGSTDSAEKESLKQEALDLSLKYKFVTPLTSMVVTKPEERDVGDLEDTEDAALLGGNKGPSPPPRTYPSVSRNRAPSGGRGGGGGSGGRGGGGGGGGSYIGGGGGDPHFMIRMRGMELPVCFDIRAEPGSVMRLLQDKNTGLTVNAGIIPSFVTGRNGEQRTYIGEIVILADQIITRITPDRILINGAEISWKDENPFTLNNVTYTVKYWSKRFKILQVAFGDDIRLLVKSRHADINMAVNYLNIYIDKEDGLSKNSEGIIGEFIHDKIALRHVRVNQKGQVVGSLRVIDKSQRVKVKANVRTVLKARNNTITGEPEMCWNAHKSVTGLLQKDTKEYFIKDILLQ